ncbi:Bicyclomycin resistance protein [Microbacterium hydrocarbonoxydans]|uniref:Bicyclomycin resistance protein n=1 Tax=Microbacterium hydrocarbonoxydans TaxID=273678 RepID=A0A0M2HQ24_9MICO|nr:multidrug effflux MFS transporter [Microbacterium hydrocarbonoxydans]KJL47028.1 Bicyclomycin resistance protein [Microbacterium hydrocarbonoxydans]
MTNLREPSTDSIRTVRPAITARLLGILALLAAVAPFATDLYLPAFPAIASDLATDATGVQLTLTAFLVGVAGGQLLFGPLSDQFGRRLPLLVGAIVFVLSSLVTVFAPTLEVLFAARVLQGLSGAAGMVLGRAVIADLARGPAAARAMSLMMIVGGVAPVIAPLLGGALAEPLGWRGVLAVVLGIAVLTLLAVTLGVRETLPSERRAELALLKRASGSPLRALLSREYIGYTLTFAFAFTVMMAYISASPFLYQSMLGLDELQYGLMFGLNALALMATSAVSAKIVARVPARRLIATGLSGMGLGVLAFLVLAVTSAPVWLLAVAVFVIVASLGFVLGNATALALSAVPGAAGSASAVLGALQFALAALVSPLVSIGGEDTAIPLALVMAAAIAVAGCAFAGARQRA